MPDNTDPLTQESVYASLGGIYKNENVSNSQMSFGTYTCNLKNVKTDDGTVISCTSVDYTYTNNGTILITLPEGGYIIPSGSSDITRFVTAKLSGNTITTEGGETYSR